MESIADKGHLVAIEEIKLHLDFVAVHCAIKRELVVRGPVED
jgi:hypothetical protein